MARYPINLYPFLIVKDDFFDSFMIFFLVFKNSLLNDYDTKMHGKRRQMNEENINKIK